jgi:hypothetical protein
VEQTAGRIQAHPDGLKLLGQSPRLARRDLLTRPPALLAPLLDRHGDGNGLAQEVLCEEKHEVRSRFPVTAGQ